MPAISPPGCACRKSLSARTLSISPRVVPIPSACQRGLHRHVDGQLTPPMTISERHVRKVITRDPDIVVRSPSMLSAVSACHAAVPPWDDSWRRSRVFSTRRRGTISGLSMSDRSVVGRPGRICRRTRPHLRTSLRFRSTTQWTTRRRPTTRGCRSRRRRARAPVSFRAGPSTLCRRDAI